MTATKSLKIVFIHLDLGIGGAEQLVLQLATAGLQLGHSVALVTTRCDADHCFASVAPGGSLAKCVTIYGNWIPPTIGGIGQALLSTLRILYLTCQVLRNHDDVDVCVVDVLPTSLPLLRWISTAATMFYCHFPDKLLLRSQTKSSGGVGGLKLLYRYVLDSLEAYTMTSADLIVVNSQFTKTTVQATFASLAHQEMPILYPALDTSMTQQPSSSSSSSPLQQQEQPKTNLSPIVSLNRFERKKNISLVIYAYQYLKQTYPDQELPPLIVAGGYDTKNVENVEYRGELQSIVNETQLQSVVTFKCDISDVERSQLFQTALGVVYTPDKEHFGIVPLEAMYAGTPVLAVNSGGPMETVVDGVTGFLRSPTPQEFGEALLVWIKDPSKAIEMGQKGKKHVEAKFGTKRLEQEFQALLEKTLEQKEQSMLHLTLWSKVGLYLLDALYAILAAVFLTLLLQRLGVLHPNESILGGIKRTLSDGEL